MTRSRQIGLVTITRKRGRIAGFGAPPVPLELLWCGTNRPRKKFGKRKNGWSFPPAVRELLLQELEGKTCVHLFGGAADFGFRLDLDPLTRPDVIGDAFLPPFAKNSFDAVILDPPYYQMRQQERDALFRAAAWISRDRLYWFHAVWVDDTREAALEKAWLIRVGHQCAIRTLQRFKVLPQKRPPLQMHEFTRGWPLRYKRWAEREAKGMDLFAGKQNDLPPAADVPIGKSSPVAKPGVYLGDWK